ncbi:MAG TPA: aminotransferase class I/II-fold pyridoxal phosphate-dependent enzyme, partial [Paracoccaceae bacterium]|nr:aminotransferase class I/II-fold pyridoxal phosphate-dependent enzyme [Paracoccaceae bacterium]
MRSSRRGVVDPFIVMDVMESARQAEEAGRHIIHMEVGQPGTPAPAGARAALTQAMEAGNLGYTVALGLPELRARIARLYLDWYGVTIDPERIVITPGSSGGFILAFTALFDAGARVGVPEPGYPSYRQILKALDLVPVGIATSQENRLQPAPDDLAGMALDGLMVASPANPSGTMLGREALGALIGACDAAGISFISDEIYHGVQYEDRAVSALEISDDVYVINSFSK